MLTIATHSLDKSLTSSNVLKNQKSDKRAPAVPFEKNNIPLTTQDSLKLDQNLILETHEITQRGSESSQSSVSSASSATFSDSSTKEYESTSQEYVDSLIKQSNSLLEAGNEDLGPGVLELLKKLTSCLAKTKNQANSYKIKSELLSISSKDADMRYEVENDLIKKEVESLKHQSENRDYLMNKINHQKLTLKKYKHEIISKNKEIIELTNKLNKIGNDKKRKLFRSHTTLEQGNNGNMLDTLGLLASQVLTEEEKYGQKTK